MKDKAGRFYAAPAELGLILLAQVYKQVAPDGAFNPRWSRG